MGIESQATVYAAELGGIILALRIALADSAFHGRSLDIFTDNQSALKTLLNPQQSSGQYLVREIINLLG
jgi:hypothetical protein